MKRFISLFLLLTLGFSAISTAHAVKNRKKARRHAKTAKPPVRAVGKIAFLHQGANPDFDDWQINVMNGDGTQSTQIVPSDYVYGSTPRFSSNAKKIVFESGDRNSTRIYLMNADGSNSIRLTDENQGISSGPSFSPDGTKIVFSSRPRSQDDASIWVMNSDGTHKRRLTQGAFDDAPRFSPDGKKIAFVSNHNGTGGRIYLMNADGTNPKRLTSNGTESGPYFSPDGKKIAFAAYPDGVSSIYVMNRDGTQQKRLTPAKHRDIEGVFAGVFGGRFHSSSPCFSPDGKKIAFTVTDGYGQNIWVMNADGTNRIPLTKGGDNFAHSWVRGSVPAPAQAQATHTP